MAGGGGGRPPRQPSRGAPRPAPAAPRGHPRAQSQTQRAPAAATPAPASVPMPADKPDPHRASAEKGHDPWRGSLGPLAYGSDVTASGGTVTLWGTVPKAAKRHVAVRAATGVAGVKSVKDNMAIVAGS